MVDLAEWRQIPYFPKYEMSKLGDIRDEWSGEPVEIGRDSGGEQFVTLKNGTDVRERSIKWWLYLTFPELKPVNPNRKYPLMA